MGDSETAQQGSAGEHAGDVTDNGHAGDVADDEVVGAVPPGAFGPAATSSLQDSLLLMSTVHSNHGSTSSTSPSDVMSTVLAKRTLHRLFPLPRCCGRSTRFAQHPDGRPTAQHPCRYALPTTLQPCRQSPRRRSTCRQSVVYPGECPVLSGGKTLDVPLKKWRMV